MLSARTQESGDTLVEVLVALAVMAVITVGALAIMNKGIGDLQNSQESASVRTELNGQIEVLTYARDQYLAAVAAKQDTSVYPASLWGDIKAKSVIGTDTGPQDCSTNNGFYMNYTAANVYSAAGIASGGDQTSSTTPIPGTGLWIEGKKSPAGATIPYVDFYIKACWKPIAGDIDRNMSSTLRLYDQ